MHTLNDSGMERSEGARLRVLRQSTPQGFRSRDGAQPGERDIARLLARRYGDGTVYLPSGEGMGLLHTCMALGFVSTDGIITSKGRRFLIRYTD